MWCLLFKAEGGGCGGSTLTGARFTKVNLAPASPGLRVRQAAPAGEAIN
jgi:hypothetical protein